MHPRCVGTGGTTGAVSTITTTSTSAELAEKLKSGYVDLAVMLTDTDSGRNVLAEWNEQLVWAGAPHRFPLSDGEPIPFVGREDGFMDRRVMSLLDEKDITYRRTITSADMGVLVAAVEAGIGVMIVPERYMPEPLVRAKDRVLPKLPEVRAAVFCKEGFDIKRNKVLVSAFVDAVRPSNIGSNGTPHRR